MKSQIKSYIRFLASALVLTMGATGCDYLDVVPPETADIPDTMKDKQDAIDFLSSCHSCVAPAAIRP